MSSFVTIFLQPIKNTDAYTVYLIYLLPYLLMNFLFEIVYSYYLSKLNQARIPTINTPT